MKLAEVTTDLKNKIAEHYCGSCESVSQWVIDDSKGDESDSIAEEDVLSILGEKEVEECAICGWWHSMDEMSESSEGDLVCEQCAEYNEDE